ncbi:MAG: N-acetyltransferase, partial [Chitinophagaceae bacterium]|nr:N-acetyltransferase [Chitinophagaceae bacterium]
ETKLTIENCVFRQRIDSDPKNRDDDGPYILLHNNSVVAYGGLMYNYNAPYADVYMHVVDGNRQQGFGGLFVQELKRLAYEQNKVPAARCHIKNSASRKTLEKAGFVVCGYLLVGDVSL